MKLKVTLLFLCAILLSGTVWSQDVPDYVWKTPMTKIYPTGEAYNLPAAENQVNYKNPNTTTRVVNTGQELLVLPPNVRPFPHTATQSEVDATNMGGNGQNMFASWNSFGPSFWGTGFCFSNNGGTTWSGNFQMYSPNSGDPGAIIWPTGSTWPGRLGLSSIQGFGHSTNDGATWVFDMNFPGASSFDKNFSAVDDIVGSPFFGRAYTVWTNFAGSFTNRIVGSFSTDGGATWSTAAPVSPVPAGGHHHQGCDIEVGPGGIVYVVWANCTTNGQNSTEDFLAFAKSTDGGVTWTGVNDNAVDVNGIRAANLFNGIRASGFPRIAVDHTGGARNGWIYVTLAEKNIAPATDVADVTICISSNGGTSWTHSRVNQDTPGSGRYQYMSAICVSPDGGVNVTYYDQRNTTGVLTEYWMSRSLNGGSTWTDVAVSDHSFTPAPISGLAGGYQGDYTGCTSSSGSGKIFPFWADNSSGIYQVWTVGIIYGPPPANDVIAGPFLSLPTQFIINNAYNIRARITNGGTNAQTNLPVRFSVNGAIQTTNTIASLPAGAVDSSTFSWTPTVAGTYTLRIIAAAPVDENRANDTVATVVTVLTSAPQIINACRSGISIPINDNSLIRDSVLVALGSGCTVTDVNVRIDQVIHTWDADLSFYLQKASVGVKIINRVGSSGDNFINTVLDDGASTPIASGSAPFTGSFIPSNSLAPFNAQSTDGYWRLVVTDTALGDVGTLNAWCVVVSYSCPTGGIQTAEIPNHYSLAQNYPNPFNPSTTIKFGMPKGENVKLVIYDMLGREVKVLLDEFRNAGTYEVNFDASSLASGAYFYKLVTPNFTQIKKMLLVK